MSTVGVNVSVNAEAVRAVWLYIQHFPERWNQFSYLGHGPGGTPTRCFAGWAVTLAGYDLPALLAEHGTDHVYELARRLLGFSRAMAQRLFTYQYNHLGEHPTLAEFRRKIIHVTGVSLDAATA